MNIDIKLNKNFSSQFNSLLEKYGTEMAKLNGFADEQLSYTDFIDNFVDKKVVADASIDGSSNVFHKDIVSLENEMSKPHSKLLAFNKIFYELNKKYGFKVAKEWLEAEWTGELYLHDAYASSFKSYCFAYDLEKLVKEGLFFIDNFNSAPPSHLTTYTDFVAEFVSWNCNRTSGAIGLPGFLIYSYYFWKKDCSNNYFLKNPEYYRDQGFQEIIYRLNQPFLRGGIQSAFTNFSIFDKFYLEALFGGKEFPDGSLVIDQIDEILEYQKRFMEVCSRVRQENMMTFPVLSFALLRKDGKFADENFAKWCCEHNMKWADSNFFISEDITSLSNCCRLKSNIRDLGYFNSIGSSALEVGSIKVNTVNLARISYKSDTEALYLKNLKVSVTLCLKTLDIIRHVISRNIEKGLLPNYSLELIKLKSQYNTIGIIGIYETLQKFGYTYKDEFGYTFYKEEGIDFAKNILKTINDTKSDFTKDKDYMVNVEQIPGETAAATLMKKDMFFYPEQAYELPLYANQWYPLGIKTTLQEKIRVSAILDKACNGGSIAHINIDAPFSNFDMAWNLLNRIADAGVTYFAFNLKINACANNHGFYGDTCPICGGKVKTTYQRIVGFLVPENTYSKERKEEFLMRDWTKLKDDKEL